MLSPTLTTILFIVLSGHRVISTTENPGDISNSSAKICEPKPTVRFLGARSICTFTVKEDIDFRRVPRTLEHFTCNCPSSPCSDRGDYRCLQLRKNVQVPFKEYNASAPLEYVKVNTSCVCASPFSWMAHRFEGIAARARAGIIRDVNRATKKVPNYL